MHPDAVQLLELIRRAADGEDPDDERRAQRAVDQVFIRCEPRVYRVCLRYLGERERALEMTQDVLLTGFRRLGEYRGEGSFPAFLYGIARFKCMRALEKRRDYLTGDGVLDGVEDEAQGPVTGLRRQERIQMLRDAAAVVLDDVEQEAVYLRYERGLSQDEIGRILGLTSRSGGRGLLQRCRRKIRAELLRRKEELGLSTSFLAGSP